MGEGHNNGEGLNATRTGCTARSAVNLEIVVLHTTLNIKHASRYKQLIKEQSPVYVASPSILFRWLAVSQSITVHPKIRHIFILLKSAAILFRQCLRDDADCKWYLLFV